MVQLHNHHNLLRRITIGAVTKPRPSVRVSSAAFKYESAGISVDVAHLCGSYQESVDRPCRSDLYLVEVQVGHVRECDFDAKHDPVEECPPDQVANPAHALIKSDDELEENVAEERCVALARGATLVVGLASRGSNPPKWFRDMK